MKTYAVAVRGGPLSITVSKPELAVRFAEVLTNSARPDGFSAAALLLDLAKSAPELHDTVCDLAEAASDYFLECCGVSAAQEEPSN